MKDIFKERQKSKEEEFFKKQNEAVLQKLKSKFKTPPPSEPSKVEPVPVQKHKGIMTKILRLLGVG